MQSILPQTQSPDITEIVSLITGCKSSGSCGCPNGMPCETGCWFHLGTSACELGASCNHCHEEICCILSDMRRKEIRREHSRLRPSKSKRDHFKRMQVLSTMWEQESASTAGCESSHSAVSPGHVSPEPSHVQDEMQNIEQMVELIRIAVETDGLEIQ